MTDYRKNSDINIKLLSILKLHDVFKSGAKTDDLIISNFINNMQLRHRLALLDEISRKIESLEQVPIEFMLKLLVKLSEFKTSTINSQSAGCEILLTLPI